MEQILSTAQRLDAAEKALVAANEQATTANAALATSRAETVSANETIMRLNADLATAKASIESLNTELATANSALESANAAKATAQAEYSDLRAKEQDVEKRASARLQQMQAAIGVSPPLPTGPAAGAAQGKPNPAASLTGLERAIAAHKANPAS